MAIQGDKLFDIIEKLNKNGDVTQEVKNILRRKAPVVVEELKHDFIEFRDYLKKYDK